MSERKSAKVLSKAEQFREQVEATVDFYGKAKDVAFGVLHPCGQVGCPAWTRNEKCWRHTKK